MTVPESLAVLNDVARQLQTAGDNVDPNIIRRITAAIECIREFHAEIVQALYADRETGQLTGDNTIPEKSCVDFVEVIAFILDQAGLAADLESERAAK